MPYTQAQTADLNELSEAIFAEIKNRTKETDLGVPTYTSHPGGAAYWYYDRTVEGSEYPIYCRVVATDPSAPPDTEGDIPGEEVLLDGNLEAGTSAFFSIGALSVSLDGRLLAYSTDRTGDERFVLRIKDLQTEELLVRRNPRHRLRGHLGAEQSPVLYPGGRGLAAVRGSATLTRHRPRR